HHDVKWYANPSSSRLGGYPHSDSWTLAVAQVPTRLVRFRPSRTARPALPPAVGPNRCILDRVLMPLRAVRLLSLRHHLTSPTLGAWSARIFTAQPYSELGRLTQN